MFSGVTNLRVLGGIALVTVLVPLAAPGQDKDPADDKVVALTKEAIRQFIAELGHPRFQVRDAAQQELSKAAQSNQQTLLAECMPVYARTEDPEVRVRLRQTLRKIFEIHVVNRPRGFLGIGMMLGQAVDPDGKALQAIRVTSVIPNTSAAAVDLHVGDLILAINDFEVNKKPTLQAFSQYVQSRPPGETVKLIMKREDRTQPMEVKLGDMTEEARNQVFRMEPPVSEQFKAWLKDRLTEEETKK